MTIETYPLSEFLGAVSGVISETFEGSFWITAEIAAVHQKNKGYWVLELQESDEKGNKLAQTQALVWAPAVPRVIYKFERGTGQKLGPGLRVRIRVQAGFHPQWGFRLTCDDIDTSWSLGEAEANNKKIKETLEKEGLWEKNKLLPKPWDFFKVGVLSPDMSAGLEDFLKEAQKIEALGLCEFKVAIAPFEGPNAAAQIPAALQKLYTEHSDLDAICVVRGGGAASGIAWLNNIDIIRAICLCPVPVITGIGHERDNTLADDVANLKMGTPSKTIKAIENTIVQNAKNVEVFMESIRRQAERQVVHARENVERKYTQVFSSTKNLLDRARMLCQGFMREALALGPQSILTRGYAVVTSGGKVIRSVHEARHTEDVVIRLMDGTIHAKIDTESAESSLPAVLHTLNKGLPTEE